MTSSTKPDPSFIAQQLRTPFGEAAGTVGKKMDEVNEPLFALVHEAMQPIAEQRILEIGFGTGSFMRRLFSEPIELHGIDLSPEMMAVASRTNRELVESGRLTLREGASDHLPFQDKFFDKIFCNMVVYFWDQPDAHLKEVRRTLREGGTFYTGIRTVESMKQFPFVQFGFNLHEPEEWIDILERNGFRASEVARRLDPIIKDEDGDFQMESLCIAALKV